MNEPKSSLTSLDNEFDALNHIAAATTETADFTAVVPRVLEILGNAVEMRYATLSLVDMETGEISIDSGYGLTEDQVRRGHYQIGEGVVGKVVASGKVAVVPSIRSDPVFLNKTGLRSEDASYICVPVMLGEEIIGTLSVDGDCRPMADLEAGARFLAIVAAMLAQAAKSRATARENNERLLRENERLRTELDSHTGPRRLIGKSREMQIVFDQIAQVADSMSTVLIHGETGTGKELVAQALHYNRARADGPFVKVNCAALPESLIESELFGHEKGAFTGAVAMRKGRFEQADGGTLFLDEIGDISPIMQVKLLRVLQEREFERVGGTQTIKVDVRIVAATHRDLYAMTRQGIFREDLYYRINVFPICLVPLKRRVMDIPLLAAFFLRKYATAARKNIDTFSPEALESLARHPWPGNVRELENCIEYAVILCNGSTILSEHLPATLREENCVGEQPITQGDMDYRTMVDEFERKILCEALEKSNGNITRAARHLKTTPRIISYRIHQLDIDISRYSGV